MRGSGSLFAFRKGVVAIPASLSRLLVAGLWPLLFELSRSAVGQAWGSSKLARAQGHLRRALLRSTSTVCWTWAESYSPFACQCDPLCCSRAEPSSPHMPSKRAKRRLFALARVLEGLLISFPCEDLPVFFSRANPSFPPPPPRRSLQVDTKGCEGGAPPVLFHPRNQSGDWGGRGGCGFGRGQPHFPSSAAHPGGAGVFVGIDWERGSGGRGHRNNTRGAHSLLRRSGGGSWRL